jgi:hypothetical protein
MLLCAFINILPAEIAISRFLFAGAGPAFPVLNRHTVSAQIRA